MDEKNYFVVHVSQITFVFVLTISPQHPAPLYKHHWIFFYILIMAWITCTPVSVVFCLYSNPKRHLSLCRALIFQVYLGIHPKVTHKKLFYYYHFMNKHHLAWMSVHNFYNITFNIFLQTPYIATGSNPSWVKMSIVELVVIIREIILINKTRQLLKVLRPILI